MKLRLARWHGSGRSYSRIQVLLYSPSLLESKAYCLSRISQQGFGGGIVPYTAAHITQQVLRSSRLFSIAR